MGLRFRKILKIAPGLWINLSKSGGSLSVGGKGATLNIGRDGVRSTLGVPGSGLSYSDRISLRRGAGRPSAISIAIFVLALGLAAATLFLK
jgi:hypothetical protein